MSETDWSDNSGEAASSPPKQRWTPRLAAQAVVAGAGAAALAVAEFAEDVGDRGRRFIGKTNRWAESSRFIGRKYGFKERFTRLSVELRAGVVTFLMMSYVLAVNPQILGATGGVCDAETLCSPQAYERLGRGCLFRGGASEAAVSCLSNLVMNLTTATAASSLIACFIVGFFGNMPVALASGMGINIYVAYQIVGQEQLTYQQAMTAIFVEAWIFIILSLSGVRGAIMRYMPSCIAYAASVGIGLLLAFTGLRNLGVIVFDDNTLVALGGCTIKDRNNIFTIPQSFSSDLNVTSAWTYVEEASPNVYGCNGATLRNATLWLGVAGGVLMALLHAWRVNGSLFLGIAFVTVVSWIPGHAASYLGAESSIPGGETRMEVFKQVVAAPSLDQTGLAWDWSAIDTGQFWLAVFTFLYIDLLDCTGTLLSMAGLLDDCMKDQAEEEGRLETYKPFVSDKREFRGQQWAFLADGIGILSGSMMGVTPLTVYIESAAGIEDGGRTGVVAITVSFCFFVALFFSPILSSIPPYATGPALVLVGVLLIVHVDRIKWDDTVQAVPAFLTIIMMPFTLSVAYGIIAGLGAYIILHIPFWFLTLVSIARARLIKRDVSAEDLEAYGNGFHPRGPPSPSPSMRRAALRRRAHRKVFGDEAPSATNSDDGMSFRSRHEVLDDLGNVGGYGVWPSDGGTAGASARSSPVPVRGMHRSPSAHSVVDNPEGAARYGAGGSHAGSSMAAGGGGSYSHHSSQRTSQPRNLQRIQSLGNRMALSSNVMGARTSRRVGFVEPQEAFDGGIGFGVLNNRGLSRSRTFADMASAAREEHDLKQQREAEEKAAQPPKEDVHLFGDFKLLDLNLDSSGSSNASVDLDHGQQSADMSMFKKEQGGESKGGNDGGEAGSHVAGGSDGCAATHATEEDLQPLPSLVTSGDVEVTDKGQGTGNAVAAAAGQPTGAGPESDAVQGDAALELAESSMPQSMSLSTIQLAAEALQRRADVVAKGEDVAEEAPQGGLRLKVRRQLEHEHEHPNTLGENTQQHAPRSPSRSPPRSPSFAQALAASVASAAASQAEKPKQPLPNVSSLPIMPRPQSAGGAHDGAPLSPFQSTTRPLKRVESAAATRLRGLFQLNDEDDDEIHSSSASPPKASSSDASSVAPAVKPASHHVAVSAKQNVPRLSPRMRSRSLPSSQRALAQSMTDDEKEENALHTIVSGEVWSGK